MPRSMHAFGIATLAAIACAQTSQPPPSTTAPVVSASVAADPTVVASAAPPGVAPVPTPAPTTSQAVEAASGGDGGAGAQFRACKADADCVAVLREGCCHNGWKEAVAVSQTDAYRQANACTRSARPICPMYIARDARVARCDPQSRLCTMTQP